MKNTAMKKGEYQKLLDELRAEMEKGRQQARQALSEIVVRTNWRIGKRLSLEADRLGGLSADFMGTLGADLEVATSELYRALQFYRTYPDGVPENPDEGTLTWGVHKTLLPVQDPEAREYYKERAAEEKLSASALRTAIKNDAYGAEKAGKAGPGTLDRPASGLHTYVAEVERVVDGDTLVVRIDLGFDVWKTERIRLRGVDSPELGSPEGGKAKQFVIDTLNDIPFVVLRTYKTDRYARYVADVFFDPTRKKKLAVFEKGRFLNQELLDRGHAYLAV